MSIRSLIERSWAATQRRVRALGPLPPNAASFAGRMLEEAKGDARTARDAVPEGAGEDADFYRRVKKTLSDVVNEESEHVATKRTGS